MIFGTVCVHLFHRFKADNKVCWQKRGACTIFEISYQSEHNRAITSSSDEQMQRWAGSDAGVKGTGNTKISELFI